MFFQNNIFTPEQIGEPRSKAILLAATDRAAGKVRPSDLLAAAIDSQDAKILATLAQALEPGSTPQDLKEIIEVYNPARTTPTDFDGRQERFAAETLSALNQFEEELKTGKEGIQTVALELLLSCVLAHPDAEDREYLSLLNAERGVELFRQQITLALESLDPLFDSASGKLRAEEFSESALAVLENAAIQAKELGYDQVLAPHCFLALLGETEGVAEQIVRLQAALEAGPAKVIEVVNQAFRLGERKAKPPELNKNGIGQPAIDLFKAAQKAARLWGTQRIHSAHLLLALLEGMPPRLADVLQRSPLSLNLEKMRQHLDLHLRESRKEAKKEVAFRLPETLLPSEDLTYLARTGKLPPAIEIEQHKQYFEAIEKALYRRDNNHVLITGLRGVGKTTLVRELSRRAAEGKIVFLKRKRFLWVDCQDVPPAESRNKFEGLLAQISGRSDLILILDGLGPLLRAESGADNKMILRNALKENRLHLIGAMSNSDYEDLLSADEQMLAFLTRVKVEEPKEEEAIKIVKLAGADLEKAYKVRIEEKAIERAVILSANFIMNERLPVKAIKILRRVCENIDYQRTQKAAKDETVTVVKVICEVSEISGVPEATVSGVGEKLDFENILTNSVVGQDEAVRAVAEELRLIKAGLTDPGKPASVMFFAGLTGVGKSELAKAIAKIYSSSKKLQTYTMGNFTEPHSISGIIGVPAGYVGHEQGGRLINDINSDPYCVFLLDEAEKAHPDVWKPFLNLFDEGWIADQRGVKAFADRSLFILTSNAGQSTISSMSQEKKPMDKIIEKVKEEMTKIVNERSGQPIFSPEFLARIKRIIIFKPLDQAAMEGICRKLVSLMQRTWKEKREKDIIVPENLIKYIAAQSHQENEKSGGKEGGRIVRKKISELIEASIQQEASQREQEYKNSDRIELLFLTPDEQLPRLTAKPAISVTFSKTAPPSPTECVARTIDRLKSHLDPQHDTQEPLPEVVSASLVQLEKELNRWTEKPLQEKEGNGWEKFLERFRMANAEIQKVVKETETKSRAIVAKLVEKD
ncbi:ATP-dependent Clp protease ATP-binding subunit [candidate division KSB1 bacterium]|nr:ATP-dependent Clp protease ATP-binding subunit [candidate division KSB1 bacterium]